MKVGRKSKMLTPLQNITKNHLFNYIENFTTKNWKFSDKNSDIYIFYIFLLKYRLWVLVGTAVPTIYVCEQK